MAENKPLKGKILLWNETTGDVETTDGKYFLMTKAENGKYVEILLKSDVQSAVQGLLQEIRKEEREREICAYNVADYDEGGARFQSGFASGLRHAQYLIKRWFPDVFEDENEKK